MKESKRHEEVGETGGGEARGGKEKEENEGEKGDWGGERKVREKKANNSRLIFFTHVIRLVEKFMLCSETIS